jgi:TatA/E family protein of Tat protein translocase
MRNFPIVTAAKMDKFSVYHWLIVFIVVLLFGGRKIPQMTRGVGDGIHAFWESCLAGRERSQSFP